jgi:hypothetical protein
MAYLIMSLWQRPARVTLAPALTRRVAVPWALPWVMVNAGCWYNPATVGFVVNPPLESIIK